ncbi:glycosyltransferase family 2 protein [Celeribacter arenosi]|uniref:Glycosyltransferase family 2 protein n=1 Tax=Celeribacter arenosi TaxID=792649 RepID=A0ABP7JRM1_9RHOB
MDGASVLVVVPTLNEAAHIEACLMSILEGTVSLSKSSLVVVDGGSQDKTRKIVRRLAERHPQISLVDNPDRFQSAGVNRAVERFAGPKHHVLIRCDAHAIYPPDYIERLTARLMQTGAASVVTVMDATGETPFARAAAWIVDTPLGSGGSAHRGGADSGFVDHGHHAAFDLSAFRDVGGYDPTFSHNEDAELDVRLAQSGGKIWLDATIRLDYVMRPTLRGLLRQYWNYGKGRARTVGKHSLHPRLRQLLPAVNFALLVLTVLGGMFFPLLWVLPIAYFATVAAVSVLAAVRLRDPSGLWAGPSMAAMHNGWAAGFLFQIFGDFYRSKL